MPHSCGSGPRQEGPAGCPPACGPLRSCPGLRTPRGRGIAPRPLALAAGEALPAYGNPQSQRPLRVFKVGGCTHQLAEEAGHAGALAATRTAEAADLDGVVRLDKPLVRRLQRAAE